MKIREIENLLSQMKDDSRVGGIDDSEMASARSKVFAHVDSSLAEAPVKNSVFEFVTSIPTTLTDMVARPTAFASLLVVMVLGGWITSVNASLDTLPGDVLYPVKLVSERAQLTLASQDTKTRLYAEFAARRLNEITSLVNSDDDRKDEHVQTAINGFNKQIDSVNAQLTGSSNKDTVVALARIIDKQTAELESVLDMSNGDEGSHSVIAEAVDSNDQISSSVVEALVGQSEDSHVTRNELERQFTNEIRTIRSRADTLQARVNRILTVAETREDVEVDIENVRVFLVTIDLSDAMNFAAAGGYERAFSMTGEVKQALRDSAAQLAAVEIQLTAPPVIEEEVAEVEEEVESEPQDPVVESQPENTVEDSNIESQDVTNTE